MRQSESGVTSCSNAGMGEENSGGAGETASGTSAPGSGVLLQGSNLSSGPARLPPLVRQKVRPQTMPSLEKLLMGHLLGL